MCRYVERKNYPYSQEGSERFLRSDPPLKVALLEVECPARDPHFPSTLSVPTKLAPHSRVIPSLPLIQPPGGVRPGSGKSRLHFWFLRSYLSSGLRNLKTGAFEEPHHLDLQRLLERRLRAARGRPRPTPLGASHGGTRGLLRAQTLRVTTATVRLRPRSFQGGGR